MIGIENAAWPIGIRTYMKLRNTLAGAIDVKRTELRKQIAEEYAKTYAQLEQGCKENEVSTSVLSDQEVIVKLKTQPIAFLCCRPTSIPMHSLQSKQRTE